MKIIYKYITNITVLATFTLLIILTIDVIYETDNWVYFNIDFKDKYNIISAYGSLIGGILAFLSILFVLRSLIEQRQEILNKEDKKIIEYKNELLERLKLINDFTKSAIKQIIRHGNELEKYYKLEKENPSLTHPMAFEVTRNFRRVIDMDPLSLFKALNTHLPNKDISHKTFLNLLGLFDYYNDSFIELKENYKSQTALKFDELRKMSQELKELLENFTKALDSYKNELKENYTDNDWVIVISNTINSYADHIKTNNLDGFNFSLFSEEVLLPFITKGMELNKTIGYDNKSNLDLILLASSMRKDINQIESLSIYYADNIKEIFDKYYKKDNENLIKLDEITKLIDEIIK